ncbi:MAG TPA: crossover junction endodeoxyribonuclease RuvC [Bacillota bacterium]
MRIFGVDPGTAIVGYGVIDQEGSKLIPVDFGVIRTPPNLPCYRRLALVHQEVTEKIRCYRPEIMAIEELFFNKNTRTALSVGEARGVIMLAAAEADLPVEEYTPLQVKMAVVGYGRAQKGQVQEMVKLLLGLTKIPKPDDAADALAIAICHAHSRRNPLVRKGEGY